MVVKQVTKEQAEKIFQGYGLDVILWTGGTISNGRHQGMMCDYSKLKGYLVAFACEVWDIRCDRQVERFNVMR